MGKQKTMGQIAAETLDEFFPGEGAFAAAFGGCGDYADYFHTNATAAGLSVDVESVYMTLDESECTFTAPVGTTLEQIKEWGIVGNLSHVWIMHGGKHYDAVTPNGVNDPFELRFFRQVCVETLWERNRDQLELLKAEHPWWVESEQMTIQFLEWYERRLDA